MMGLHAVRAALVLAAGLWACGEGRAGDALREAAFLHEMGEARMPSGMASLCEREPAFCAEVKPEPNVSLDASQWALIEGVNRQINQNIVATTDEKLYGRTEYWTLPEDAGDCEDYVLLKRKTLAALGIPQALMLITVVQDENGEAHAVLSIPTPRGEVVLDNRRDEVLHWSVTGYSFVKRQSVADPTRWVALTREKLQDTNMASAPEAQVSD